MRRTFRAFTLIEVLIGIALLTYASIAFYSLYTVTTKQQIHSQFLTLVDLTADSLLEEVKAHRYGTSAPKSWGNSETGDFEWRTLSYDIRIDGKKVKTEFHIQWHMANKSFVGQSHHEQDLVTIVISWSEGEGSDPDYGDFSDTYYKDDNRHLVVQVPVWR